MRFLDISKNTKLKNLRCNDNLLTSLDVSKNTLLQSLHCERNYMASESAVVGLNRAVTTEFIFSPQGNLPSEPQNLRAIPDDRTVDLTWTFPAYGGTSTITSFEVSNNNGTSWVTAGNTTSYKFLSLNNGQSYDFKVRAVNSYGRGLEAAISATPYAPRVSPPAAARYGEASSWAIPELNQALDAGLIPLILEGENMTRAISREEFAELAVQLYEKAKGAAIVVTIPNPFTDTTNPQIMKAYQVGITAGTSATKFSPDTLITREQCATMLYRTIKAIIPGGDYSIAGVPDFLDQRHIAGWAVEGTKYMSKMGIILGNTRGEFMPKPLTDAHRASGYGMATREAAVLMTIRTHESIH